MAITAWSAFREPIRSILQDYDPDIHIFGDDALDAAMRTVVNLGRVEDYAVGDGGIDPELTVADDPTAWAQLVWYTARLFAAGITASAFTQRSFSERIGEPKELVGLILEEVHRLDHGDMAA